MRDSSNVSFRRQVRPEDAESVRRLAASTGFFSAAEVDVAEELVRERLSKGEASGYEFVFAEAQGQSLGYACYGEIACTRGSFDVYWIVVEASHQGRGVGRLLLSQVESSIARQNGRLAIVETSSRPQYAPTRRFYDRCGYRQLAVIEDFYNEGDGKVILGKRLDAASAAPTS